MINLLFDPLPECVQVDGVDYPVVTDFRDWIAFADLILDPGISQQNKVAAAMQWYLDARPPDATKALHALKWFFTAEPLLTGRQQRRMGGRPTRPVLSYSQDAACILGAFRQCYGMDLIRIDHLHYWEFRSLMQALPEDCPLKKRMAYRAADPTRIRDDAERDRVRRIQAEIAIEYECDDEEIADAFL